MSATRPSRTSATHPLRFDEVPAGAGMGIMRVTFCPGENGDSARGDHFFLAAFCAALAGHQTVDLAVLAKPVEAGVTLTGAPHRLGILLVEKAQHRFHRAVQAVQVKAVETGFRGRWLRVVVGTLPSMKSTTSVLRHIQVGKRRKPASASVAKESSPNRARSG